MKKLYKVDYPIIRTLTFYLEAESESEAFDALTDDDFDPESFTASSECEELDTPRVELVTDKKPRLIDLEVRDGRVVVAEGDD